jgi:hypothetical protein
MIVTDRLKRIIFKRLYEELGNCEIIPYKSSIWFINREEKYWYFELEEGGTLWWRYHFFIPFFDMFSMSPDDFKSVLSSWVEEVLNCKVSTTVKKIMPLSSRVEEVLNYKVSTTDGTELLSNNKIVEEVLNYKIYTTQTGNAPPLSLVEDILKHKVSTTGGVETSLHWSVEEILNQ